MSKKRIVAVVGNPNCGKTTLFNALTGSKQDVGNWPGVTVEKKTGLYTWKDETVELVDLPGIYSIVPNSTSGEDERVARDYILTNEAEAIINILDASNLERNLFLTAQLVEMRVPMVVVVNMLDVAKQHKMEIDLNALEARLGCPVVGVVGTKAGSGKDIKDMVHAFLKKPELPPMSIEFDPRIDAAAKKVEDVLAQKGVDRPHWFALQLLENAPGIEDKLPEGIKDAIAPIKEPLDVEFDHDVDIAISDARYQFVGKIAEAAIKRTGEVSTTLTDKIDRVVLNRFLGLPIFLVIMYLMFLFTQNLGAAFIDFFDVFVGGVAVNWFGSFLEGIGSPEWLTVILANGIGGGLQTVSTFIPVIAFLYFFLAILEDSGYMARAAFVMDRIMRAIGLPGKAFVPLIVGFGCNVPAIMAARTMDRASDRIITIMMAPFMSCGARLPVYVLFAAAFFPTNGQNLVFGMYIIGILAAILTGFLTKQIALPGETSAFVMEIPPYHIPTLKGVCLRTWDRLKSFLSRAGKVIVIIVAVLSFFNSMGTDGSFGHEDSEESVLSTVGQTITPIFKPLGLKEENWPAAVGIFTGIFAKEAVVGTLNSLYAGLADAENAKAEDDAKPADGEAPVAMAAAEGAEAAAPEGAEPAVNEEEEEPDLCEAEGFSFGGCFLQAVDAVKGNLEDLAGALTDPLGVNGVDDYSDTEAVAEEGEFDVTTVDIMQKLFAGETGAFAYLLMVLLYMPCVAAVAAVYREAGFAWMCFVSLWTTILGYTSAVIFWQVCNFSQDPVYATCAIALSVFALGAVLMWMRLYVQANRAKAKKVIRIVAK